MYHPEVRQSRILFFILFRSDTPKDFGKKRERQSEVISRPPQLPAEMSTEPHRLRPPPSRIHTGSDTKTGQHKGTDMIKDQLHGKVGR